MASRFDPKKTPEQEQREGLARVEAAIQEMNAALTALAHRPDPEPPQVSVSPPSVNVEPSQVTVPIEPLVEVVKRVEQAIADMPRPEAPVMKLDRVQADVDLTPIIESNENLRLTQEALREKIGNLTGGSRNQFDGRLRNERGPVSDANPYAVDQQGSLNAAAGATNRVITDEITPPMPWPANNEFYSDYIDVTNAGNVILLWACLEAFDTVEILWSDDGVTDNGNVTELENEPTEAGPLLYNVYLEILNIFTSGTHFRVHLINGPVEQSEGNPPGGTGFTSIGSVGIFSYLPLIGLEDDLSLLLEAVLTRSVGAGTKPDGTFGNVPLDGILSEDSAEASGSLPSGALPSFDPVGPIVAANVLDTGWMLVEDWNYNEFHAQFDVTGVKIFLMDASDDQGNNSATQSFAFPNAISTANVAVNLGARYFQRYFRIVIINDTGSTANNWAYNDKSQLKDSGALTFPLDQAIFDFFPASVIQAIIKGKNPEGDYVANRTGGPFVPTPAVSPLGASSTYTSDWIQVEGFVSVGLLIDTDQVSASDGIVLEFSDDGATVRRQVRRTFNAADVVEGEKFIIIPNQGDYIRIQYTNGGVAQSTFFLHFRFNPSALDVARDSLDSDVSGTSLAQITRSAMVAPDPAGGSAWSNVTRTSEVDSGGTQRSSLDMALAASHAAVQGKPLTTRQGPAAVNVPDTAPVRLDPSPLTNRKEILIFNDGGKKIYWGHTNSVSATTGTPLDSTRGIALPLAEGIELWAISSSGTQPIKVTQYGDSDI